MQEFSSFPRAILALLLCSKKEQLRCCLGELNLLLALRIKEFTPLKFEKWILNYSSYQTAQFSAPLPRPLWKRKMLQHSTTDPSSAWLGSFQQLLGQRLPENKTKPIRLYVPGLPSNSPCLTEKLQHLCPLPTWGSACAREGRGSAAARHRNSAQAETQGSRCHPGYFHWLTPLSISGETQTLCNHFPFERQISAEIAAFTSTLVAY